MSDSTINVLITSFPGLRLPSTLCLPLPSSASISTLTARLSQRLPPRLHDTRLILTTTSNKELQPLSSESISTLTNENGAHTSNILPLRLSHPICGGKGGFGSQLRAAGGRMAGRKKRKQGEENGSSRNLDGRRLRTVNEAKALAEYLAVKPEMDQREKEERRRRWETIVEKSQRLEQEIKEGKKSRVDGKWVEAKMEAENKTREAMLAALRREQSGEGSTARRIEDGHNDDESMESDASSDEVAEPNSVGTTPPSSSGLPDTMSRQIFGWDDEEELSDSADEMAEEPVIGKGKGKAVAVT